MRVATLDPFRGYGNAIRDELEDAVAVLDAFDVVKLGLQAMEEARRRVQQEQLGHRGRKNDPLYWIRNALRAGAEKLTERQIDRIDAGVQASDPTWEVTIAWNAYQRLCSAFATKDLRAGDKIANQVLEAFHTCPVPEIARLGRTLRSWSAQFLAYFTTERANNGGTEALCECLPGWSGTGWSDGSGRAEQRVTLEAIGPLRGALPLNCPRWEARPAPSGPPR